MPDKNNKKSNGENLAVLKQEGKGFSNRLSQERAYQILSQGVIFTMEDDLKEALKRQKMKADLIPGRIKKENKTQEIFADNPFFDPFPKLEETKEKLPKKINPEALTDLNNFEKKEIKSPPKPEISEKNVAKDQLPQEKIVAISQSPKDFPLQEKGEKENITKEKALPEKLEKKPEESYKEAQKPAILKEIIGENIEKIKHNLGQKIVDISSKLKDINNQEEPLLQRRKAILEKITLQKKALENFFQITESAKLEQFELEKKEQEAIDSQIKHNIEEQRWQAEEKLKKAQDLQWAQEEELEKAQMALSKVDNDLKSFLKQKTQLGKEKIEIQKFLDNIGFLIQKEEFLNKNQNFLNQKAKLEMFYKQALLQKNKQEQDLFLITQEEQKIEQDLRVFEEKVQKATDYQERRKLEQERRELAQKRQFQEKKRWELEKNKEITNNNFNLAKEKLFKAKQEEENFNQKIAEIEARIDKGIFLPEAEKYLKSKLQTKALEGDHSQELSKESQENQVVEKEEKERVNSPLTVPQPVAIDRPAPAKEVFLNKEEQETVEKIRLMAKEKEQELIQKQVVQKQVLEGEKEAHEEIKQRQEEENRIKAIAKLKQIAEQEQKKAFEGRLRGPLLKEEILKKLTKISAQEEGQRKEFLSRINKKINSLPKRKQKGFEEAVVFHPMIKKTSLFEKIIIRFLVIFLIIAVGCGIYLGILELNKKRNNIPPLNNNIETPLNPTSDWPDLYPEGSTTASSTAPSVTSTTTPQATTTPSTNPEQIQPTTTPAIAIPPVSLILVSKNNIFYYQGDPVALISSIGEIISNKITYSAFEQVSVLNDNEGVFFTAPQFFQILGTSFPQEIFNNSDDNEISTTLIYSSKYGNRLGFVLATNSTSSLFTAFKNWESQAELNTADIFNLMGKKSPAISKIFKNTIYKSVPIRYQTFALTDLGICYAVYKDYFIWTSSLEQMQKIVDKLP
ncbi:MAG: hypothetical protein PHY72_02145 [Candidatus Pacebacteria bacterium]|nr:hypothetical protein [Candidatus Paceibacterota bacterium]